ncbi:MmgE/PrpD family protein [Tsuneonella dongtanensis]|uniref:MmgE/PrpD family protein n=1 Tax=Tsuneonella dongtanensis TaxID=692370 RepID=A0A1B2AGE0_9SPHN|nr:MmgE/PrpD family protein [Tsuneonella dongtanensis]ANY21095.1 MmgE/PrpD family protein [Tsuneonella dongtanensis]
MSATSDLVAFAAARHALPAEVRAATERFVADTLAVGAAGWSGPGLDGVLATAKGWGEGAACRLVGDAHARLPANGAAYVNCFAMHCLEWDAVHEGAVVHAMTAVVPAVLAAIDRAEAPVQPDDAMAAIAVGVDIAAGLGVAASSPLRFFRPAITGIYGAAAAVARIEGLDEAQFADVLGLAHAHAAGTMQAHTEGSIALPLQFANAARGAIHAVDLVKNGLTGPHDPFEGPFGHFALFEDGNLEDYTRDLGRWRIAEMCVKPYPSGRASHAVLGALADLENREVAKVVAHVPPLIRHLVDRPHRPDMTPAYARLCLPFLCALMLTERAIDPRRFTPDAFADPALAALATRVEIRDDGNDDPNAMAPQRVEVEFADGERRDIAIPVTLGSPERLLDSRQSAAKYGLCRELASRTCDPRIFDDPIGYLVNA